METRALPFTIQELSAIAVFALSVLMVAVHSVLFARAAEQTTVVQAARRIAPFLANAFLAI